MLMFLQIIAGLAMLVLGGELLVRGGVSMAKSLGIPVLIIGLTIISLGTSAPEMVISIMSVTEGHPDIAYGNVIGSNIANVLMVLGITALIYPIATSPETTKRDGMLMVMVSVILVIFSSDGLISMSEGATFIAITIAYLLNLFRRAKLPGDPEVMEEFEEETQHDYGMLTSLMMLAGGGALLVLGADVLVGGASDMARMLGVSEAVIGATIVAIGTSAPEVATCVVAAYRKHSDIAVGNIIGSNFFNIAAVLGVASTVGPLPVAESFMKVDIWIMLGASVLLLPLMMSGKRISRVEGGCMLSAYVAYITYQYAVV